MRLWLELFVTGVAVDVSAVVALYFIYKYSRRFK
jgi:hypothetical protein